MSVIDDREFGKITIRRHIRASTIRIRVAPDGNLRVSAPPYTPQFLIKRMIAGSRDELSQMIQTQRPRLDYENGSTIGKSHSLLVREGARLNAERHGLQIVLTLSPGGSLQDADAQGLLRGEIIAALRREAKGYLPKRLKFLAEKHGFSYQRVRFSHASGRWGSCSSTGTISLNIALMKLSFELIDYVILHELAHTRHMNHGTQFWELVAQHDPSYKTHRTLLKKEVPTV